jgi:hypothetical protein
MRLQPEAHPSLARASSARLLPLTGHTVAVSDFAYRDQ